MSDFNLFDYAPIAVMFIVAFGFAASQVVVTQLVGPRKRTATKLMPYECGKDPVGSARDRFSVKFYTVALIFLVFDLEVLFMIPFAVAFKYLLAAQGVSGAPAYGTIAFVSILIFASTIVVAYLYDWRKGAFDWGVKSKAEARAEARKLASETSESAERKTELKEATA